jgi:hypothetical protein
MIHILTRGSEQIIADVGPAPEFTVTATGLYTIHTLVYDPATLDLGAIELGATTTAAVNALLIQGGGAICASLDLAGAAYTVAACTLPCEAEAGTLTGGGTQCLVNGQATLSAVPNGDAIVPEGFVAAYCLTQGPGLVLIAAALQPEFMVTQPGAYTLHLLVFDPATLDLGLVEFGVTTGYDIAALLVQGGGAICGSLGLEGAAFLVEVCNGVPHAVTHGFAMHPNPTDGQLFLRPARATTGQVDVLDMSGRVVRTMRMAATDQSVSLDLGGAVAPGSYVVRLTQAGARWERPLIVRP